MNLAKVSALVVTLAGAFSLGVWIGPRLTERGDVIEQASPVAQAAAPVTETKQAVPAPSPQLSRRRTSPMRAASSGVTPVKVWAGGAELQQRLKPLLNKGANMDIASQDFEDGEQFAMVAHAARNTEIPFVVLKHCVVDDGKGLSEAIREFKPSLDASAEAKRAREEAKSDVAAIEG
jgi:hypothetical protein